MPEHVSIGINAGPVFGALGLLAGVLRARETGVGCQLEIAQSDAAAAIDWLRSETYKAYERPESEVTGNEADNFERRAPGTAGMEAGVRYQFYATTDGYVLFMASEREFWKNFCEGVDRHDLFERWPGAQYGDHARGNTELRAILRDIFATRSSAEWLEFGMKHNTPIAPSNTPKTSPTTRSSAIAAAGFPRRKSVRRCCPRRSSSSAKRCRIPRWRRRWASTPTKCCATCSDGTMLASRPPRETGALGGTDK